jgi:hypothetical protein
LEAGPDIEGNNARKDWKSATEIKPDSCYPAKQFFLNKCCIERSGRVPGNFIYCGMHVSRSLNLNVWRVILLVIFLSGILNHSASRSSEPRTRTELAQGFNQKQGAVAHYRVVLAASGAVNYVSENSFLDYLLIFSVQIKTSLNARARELQGSDHLTALIPACLKVCSDDVSPR